MNEYERRKIVRGALSNFKYTPKTQPITSTDALINKAQLVTTKLRAHIKPVLQAGGANDPAALRTLISTCYLEAFSNFSKDELLNLCTILHVDLMMETVDKDRFGSGTPDAMS